MYLSWEVKCVFEEGRGGPPVVGGQRHLLFGYGVGIWLLVVVCECVHLVDWWGMSVSEVGSGEGGHGVRLTAIQCRRKVVKIGLEIWIHRWDLC